jgi:hypothetical protein
VGFDHGEKQHNTKRPCWLMTPVAMELVSMAAIILIWSEG